MSINKIFLLGNLCKDPELQRNQSGSTVGRFIIAVNRISGGRTETTFVTIETWNKTAEIVGKYLRKGSSVFVEGRLKQDIWEDNNGNRREKYKVVADNVQFMPRSKPADSPDPRPDVYEDEQYSSGYPETSHADDYSAPHFYGAPPEPRPRGVDPSVSSEY